MPNLDGRIPAYDSTLNTGNVSDGKLPNITGQFEPWCYGDGGTTGVFGNTGSNTGSSWGTQNVNRGTKINFDASRSSSVYSDTTKVIPANVNMYYCIRY